MRMRPRRQAPRCQVPKLRRGGGWNPHHGNWGYQLELPPDATGKRRQLRRSGFGSRDAAVAERDHARALLDLAGRDKTLTRQVADLLHSCKRGEPLPERDAVARRIRAGVPANVATTVGDYLTGWITSRTRLSPATLRSYQDHIRMYWIPNIGGIPLQDLTATHIQAVFTLIDTRNNEITAARVSTDPAVRDSAKGARTVGPASQQRILATLRAALNDAIRKHRRLLDHNPAEHVDLPSGASPKPRLWTDTAVNRWRKSGARPSPVMVWTPAHAGAFLDYAETHDIVLYALLLLATHRGLRRAELCGLRDYDVDLDAAAITITEQRTSVGYKPITKPVKSRAGERVIPLADDTVTVLRAYRARRNGWKLVSGSDWPDTRLFFVRPDGKPWHPETISQRFDNLVAASGLPPVRFHDLRHIAATLMLAASASIKEIQDTLGHASYTMTADVYTSVLEELKRTTAEATTKLIPRRPHRAA
ncbi:tyrosine-type recombinase/integrase [Micromonospora sp. NPDC023966]|uniref:tyrosine-type recombinase/integrase n=1 Tax=Micromonospora sp. NPDC023966 TaxID=3154699 RepID=UPI00340F2F53